MTELVRLYAQIALLRRGPQDVPGSALVLVATVAGYFVVNFAVSLVLPPIEGAWAGRLAVDVVFMLVWYAALLRLAGKPERFVQTASAVFGFQAVLAPLLVVTGWLMRRHDQDPAWQFPLAMLAVLLVVWLIAANSHVLKAALEWPLLACIGLVLLQIVAAWLLTWVFFPPPA
ncbi:MAG TPA: hypothetical protein VJ011_08945 [Steroidobacteraceae bacterium]|nr:hypothetical protein [Steroidobacteraceae bacterium]